MTPSDRLSGSDEPPRDDDPSQHATSPQRGAQGQGEHPLVSPARGSISEALMALAYFSQLDEVALSVVDTPLAEAARKLRDTAHYISMLTTGER